MTKPEILEVMKQHGKPWNKIVVGDLDSDERGSGARANEDKLRVELIPVRAWADHFRSRLHRNTVENSRGDLSYKLALLTLVEDLAEFQEGKIVGGQLLAHVPPGWMDAAVEVMVYGITKYKTWNWLKGQLWSVPLASAVRHAKAVFLGEWTDEESGLSHVGHLMCNLIMLATFYYTYPEGNDFPDKKFFGESDG